MSNLYIGLMSGTSLDGIDAALVDFSNAKPVLRATYFEAYSKNLRQRLAALTLPGNNEIDRLGRMDRELGEHFGHAVLKLVAQTGLPKSAICAIGSHGQSIRHRPNGRYPFTLQIGDPNTIASLTSITTVADFRRADVAAGGQGAPLVPAFHQAIFTNDKEVRIGLNLGGIANITVLDPQQPIFGFDTGPGNRLLDDWIESCLGKRFDENGQFAASGKVNKKLLQHLLDEPYFSLLPPKSTGRELFDIAWLQKKLTQFSEQVKEEDIQATLAELTAVSIARSIEQAAPDTKLVIACGGGVHNAYLIEKIKQNLNPVRLVSSAELGFDPDWIEAMAFAWLAKQRLEQKPGNIPSVTGARKTAILGGVYL